MGELAHLEPSVSADAVRAVCFAVEPFKAAYAEARPLMVRHWNEIAKNKHLMRLNPDLKRYEMIGDKLLLVTARANGALVGYFLWIIVTHSHYQHVLVAEEDLHYLLPEFRRGMTGYLLLKAACRAAIERGAELLTMREKIGHEHPALLKRLKFKPTDIVYTYAAGGSV